MNFADAPMTWSNVADDGLVVLLVLGALALYLGFQRRSSCSCDHDDEAEDD